MSILFIMRFLFYVSPIYLIPKVLAFLSRHLDWFLVICIALIACIQYYVRPQAQSFHEIKQTGVLRVLISDDPDSQYVFGKRHYGFEHQLLSAFADSLGVELRLKVVPYAEIFTLLEHGQGDIAVGGILNSDYVHKVSTPSVPWYRAKTTVVYKKGTKAPRKLQHFKDTPVLASSRYYNIKQLDMLLDLQDDYRSEYELLSAVSNGSARFVISTNYRAKIAQQYLPNLNRSFILPKKVGLVWVLPKKHDSILLEVLNQFLHIAVKEKLPSKLAHLYFSLPRRLSSYDIQVLHKKIMSSLPELKPYFQNASKKSGFDWTLLAAMAYQESHWSNDAVSPTGVKGVMQMTVNTAKELGINDRLDIDKTIVGAAIYLKKLRSRLPKDIPEPERTWFAVGAYNVGLKHVLKAYKIAKKRGLQYQHWNTISQLLPTLYGKRFRQGIQAKKYVENIQTFTNILRFNAQYQDKFGVPERI